MINSVKTMCSTPTCNKNILKYLFLEAVNAVQADKLIKNQITYTQRHLEIQGRKFVLNKPCYVVGFGKAVAGMAIEVANILGEDLERALISVPSGILKKLNIKVEENSKIEFMEGAKDNLPDENAVDSAKKLWDLVENLNDDDFLIVLISGGGSALLPLPIPPITLAEKQNLIKNLSQNGADIKDLNTVRKHLSLLKGGKLADLAYPAKVVSLILSDVVGDLLDVIASGPTVPDNTTTNDVIEILKRYSVYHATPESIKIVLENAESRKKVRAPNFDHVTNLIIGNNKMASTAAKNMAQQLGYQCVIMSHNVEGDVEVLSKIYADFARILSLVVANTEGKDTIKIFLETFPWINQSSIESVLNLDFSRSTIFIFAGEPTVVVKGKGKGGRNQQLALGFSLLLNNLEISSCNISFLGAGTDGIDGPTDAAGAFGCSAFIWECEKQNLDAKDYLKNNDAYNLYSSISNGEYLVKIGHSGTNVMDVHFLKIDPNKN